MPALWWSCAILAAAVALPWVLGLVAALAQSAWHHRRLREGRDLGTTAQRWLQVATGQAGLTTRIEVHSALVEAYFPHADVVGLSPAAAGSLRPLHRAVVAHELGHAATASLHPALRAALPIARLAIDALPFAVAATFLVTRLHHNAVLAWLAVMLVLLTTLAHGVVVADEAVASTRALRWLARDRELRAVDQRACRRSLQAALAAYTAPLVGWLLVLLALPWLVPLMLSGVPMPAAEPLDSTGTWLLLLLGPFLLLHGALVISETVGPEPVRSAFQLELRQQQGHAWAFSAGLCSLLVALGVAGWSQGLIFDLALALAVFTGLEPLTILVRALLLLPVLLGARLFGRGALQAALTLPSTDPLDVPRALASLWDEPPWFLRAARLLQLGWVPLVLLVTVGAWWRAT